MKIAKSFLAAALLVGSLAANAGASGADGILLREELPGTNYCHLQFPAITEASLSTNNPVLESSDSGDIIDFYGPCDENPVGQNQVISQRQDIQRRLDQDYAD
ncbi:MAG TPA: hypothetical protein VGL11_24050 [Candidatus Binatia bacterium]|jgi:hypothetical protein